MKKYGICRTSKWSTVKFFEPFSSEDLEQITALCELMNETRDEVGHLYHVVEIK